MDAIHSLTWSIHPPFCSVSQRHHWGVGRGGGRSPGFLHASCRAAQARRALRLQRVVSGLGLHGCWVVVGREGSVSYIHQSQSKARKRFKARRSVFHEVGGSLVIVVAMVLPLPFSCLLASLSSFLLFSRACFPSRPGYPVRPLPQCMYINTPTLLPLPLRRRYRRRHRMRESPQHHHSSRGDAGAPHRSNPIDRPPHPPPLPSFTPRRSWARGSRKWSRCPRWGTPPRWAPRATCAA